MYTCAHSNVCESQAGAQIDFVKITSVLIKAARNPTGAGEHDRLSQDPAMVHAYPMFVFISRKSSS
jgi:hypothetical protein